MDKIAGECANKVDRVLAARQGQLCWIVGTIYMEMPLKPNVLDDISKEVTTLSFAHNLAETKHSIG